MEEHIEFNFIYSDDALRVKTFLGNVPRSIECINYMDIFNKLTKMIIINMNHLMP